MNEIPENLTPMTQAAQNRCFGCGPANPIGLHLEFFAAEDQSVVSMPVVANIFEGPPGIVHGGVIATLLDEAMSKAVRVRGLTAVTRQMEVEYLRPVLPASPVRIEGRLIRSEGRKHWTEARLFDAKSHTLATAKGLFIEVRASHMTPGR
jgi:uncharacterized protein (TIGR00369 family)